VAERSVTESPPAGATRSARGGLGIALALGVASISAAFLTAAVVLQLGGGASTEPIPGIPGPGLVTTWVLPAARVLRDAAAVVTVGLLLAAAVLGPTPGCSTDAPRTMGPHAYQWVLAAGWSALVWFTVTVLDVGYTVSDIVGLPLVQVVGDLPVFGYAFGLSPIPDLAVVAGLVAVLAVACRVVLSRAGVVLLLALALAATLPPAFGGHSAHGSGDHGLAVSAMLVHVVGVVLWAGGLLALTLAHRLPAPDLDRAVRRYSRLAGWCLFAVGLSGLVNVLARIDPVGDLWQSWYGWLVQAKLGAFGMLAAVGGLHRRQTLPALRGGRRSAFVQLAIVELAIFAATIGLAVGLSRTPTPGDSSSASTHAEIDSVATPEAPGVRALLLDGRPEPVFLAVVGIAIVLYLIGIRRLRRRGESWPPAAAAGWVGGWLLATWATSGGLARYAEVLFSANLIQHLALALPIPLLLVAGRPVTLAQRTLAPADDPHWPGPREWLSALLGSRPLRLLARPHVALALQAAFAAVVYFAGLYETALRSDARVFTYGLVLVIGCAFWWGITGIDAAPHRPTPVAQAVMLGATVALLDLLGVALMHTQTDIGGYSDTGLSRPWGPSVLGDQVLAGEITLWVAGSISALIVVAAILTTRTTRQAGPRMAGLAHGHSQPQPVTDIHAG
jgi:cytochrome c oxidase assembly factor CtaG/putative copper export protein